MKNQRKEVVIARLSLLIGLTALMTLALGVLLGLAPSARMAALISVDTAADVVAVDGFCSLREAVIAANTNAPVFECAHDGSTGMDLIVLGVPGPYVLAIPGTGEDNAATGDLDILDDVTLGGGGAIIDANTLDRVFDVMSATLVISNTTVQNGYITDTVGGGIRSINGELWLAGSAVLSNTAATALGGPGGVFGGGIYSSGIVTITRSNVHYNRLLDLVGASLPSHVYAGGGLYNAGGVATIEDGSVFDTNVVPDYPTPWAGQATSFRGGGIYNASGGSVVITGSSQIFYNYVFERRGITDSLCSLAGGGIYNEPDASLTVFDSTVEQNGVIDVTGNTSCDFIGAGVYNAGRTTLTGSSILGNQSSDNGLGYAGGGGVYNAVTGVLTVTAATSFEGNRAGWGAGILNAAGGTVTLVDVSASENRAVFAGGGIYSAGTLSLSDSSIMNNVSSGSGGGIDNRGELTIGGSANTIGQNTANISGGGIHNDGGVVNVSNAEIFENEATTGGGISNYSELNLNTVSLISNTVNGVAMGGGLYNAGINAAVIFTASNVVRNSALDGGGIYNITGTVILGSSPISGNVVFGSGGGLYNAGGMTLDGTPVFSNSAGFAGAGVYNAGTVSLTNASVTSNTAQWEAGGLANAGTVFLSSSTVAGNVADSGGGIVNEGQLVANNGTIADNEALNGTGGGVRNNGGSITLNEGNIKGNRASYDGGGIWNLGTLNATGVTLLNNVADADSDNNGGGGGLYSEALMGTATPTSTATLTNCAVISNVAQDGGGVYNNGSTLIIAPGVVRDNAVNGSGGGLFNARGKLVLIETTVVTNTARFEGGGIYNELDAILMITGAEIVDNEGQGPIGGGGIFGYGTIEVADSTIANNWASDTDGGGVWSGAALTCTNVTVSGNMANARGGGIFNNPGGTLALTHVTVASNAAVLGTGDGLYMKEDTTSTLSNSIVANAGDEDCAGLGAVTSAGHNLDGDGSCGLAATGDITNTDPLLGPLQDNGGFAETQALLDGSPAIDAVPLAYCVVSADERGVARPQGPACDMGAYELEVEKTTYLPFVRCDW